MAGRVGQLMTYQLTLTELDTEPTRAVGDNVFLANLAAEYPVYIFYYPAEKPSEALEDGLRKLGRSAGNNLFVNMARLNDPQFDKITQAFEIKSLPAVVITAIATLAAPEGDNSNPYVRLDKKILSSDDAMDHINHLYLLFLRGDVADAIKTHKWKTRLDLVKMLGEFFAGHLKGIVGYLASRDFSVSLVTGKFEVKKSA
jgi:hypothetical protein